MLAPPLVGVSQASLVGSLAAAAAAVAVTYYFLAFLRDHQEVNRRAVEDLRDWHDAAQKRFQDQLDRLSDRAEASQNSYQEHVVRFAEFLKGFASEVVGTTKAPACVKSQGRRACDRIAEPKTLARSVRDHVTFFIEDYGDKVDDIGKAKLATLKSLAKQLVEVVDSDIALAPAKLVRAYELCDEAIHQRNETIAAIRRHVDHLDGMRQTGLWTAEQESALRDLKTVLEEVQAA